MDVDRPVCFWCSWNERPTNERLVNPSDAVFESLVPAVLEQKVTGKQAREAFVALVRRYGEPAHGPAPAGRRSSS